MVRIRPRTPAQIAALIEDDAVVPSKKRAAVTIIDLRTRLEQRTIFLTVSLALNTALLAARFIN